MNGDRLIDEAKRAASNAYSPYSDYPVGAALLDEKDRIWSGCNVENVAYPASMCAERNAIAAMVSHGGREIQELLLLTPDGGAPCGECLQVISEFSPSPNQTKIHLANADGVRESLTLADLLPRAFRSSEVKSNATPGKGSLLS